MVLKASKAEFNIDFALKRALEATYNTKLSKLSTKHLKKVWKEKMIEDVYEKIFQLR